MKSAALQKELDDLWSSQDLVTLFKVSAMTLHTWRKSHGLPHVDIRGMTRSSIRFVPDEVRQWAKEHGKTIHEQKILKRANRVRVDAAQGNARGTA
jgi:hypothetical protein